MDAGLPSSRVLVVLTLGLVLAGCGGGGATEWRDLVLEVPEGWEVFEEETTRLSISNVDLGEAFEEDGQRRTDEDVVAMFLTHEPSTIPDDWREFIDGREGGEVESDTAIEIDGVPATRLIFSHRSNEVRTREMAVVVPSREIVVFAQPVPSPGDENADEVFMGHLDSFDEILDSIRWGAPID